jgi:hypothetical protein
MTKTLKANFCIFHVSISGGLGNLDTFFGRLDRLLLQANVDFFSMFLIFFLSLKLGTLDCLFGKSVKNSIVELA